MAVPHRHSTKKWRPVWTAVCFFPGRDGARRVVGQSASLTSFLSQHRSENFTPTPIFLDVDVLLLMALHCESDTYTGAIRLGFDSEAAEREVGATVLGMTGSAGAQ